MSFGAKMAADGVYRGLWQHRSSGKRGLRRIELLLAPPRKEAAKSTTASPTATAIRPRVVWKNESRIFIG